MAKAGETVDAVVVEVQPRERHPQRFGPDKVRPGVCVVECEWGTYHLIDGSIQAVHVEDRVVGRKGRLRWHGGGGGYNGPVWVRNPEGER